MPLISNRWCWKRQGQVVRRPLTAVRAPIPGVPLLAVECLLPRIFKNGRGVEGVCSACCAHTEPTRSTLFPSVVEHPLGAVWGHNAPPPSSVGTLHPPRGACIAAVLVGTADALTTLEVTQGQILSQFPTDAARFWWHSYGS